MPKNKIVLCGKHQMACMYISKERYVLPKRFGLVYGPKRSEWVEDLVDGPHRATGIQAVAIRDSSCFIKYSDCGLKGGSVDLMISYVAVREREKIKVCTESKHATGEKAAIYKTWQDVRDETRFRIAVNVFVEPFDMSSVVEWRNTFRDMDDYEDVKLWCVATTFSISGYEAAYMDSADIKHLRISDRKLRQMRMAVQTGRRSGLFSTFI